MRHVAWTLALALGLAACSTRGGGGYSGFAGGGWAARAPAYGSGFGPAYGPAPLVGGETDDNVRLPEYLEYVAAYPHRDVPKLDLTDRRVITVVGGDGMPLWDAGVRVSGGRSPDFHARTNAAGQFLLPPAALGLDPQTLLGIATDEWGSTGALRPDEDVVVVSGAHRRSPAGVSVDIALVVDTTGSMADEVARLRTTLQSVVAQVGRHPAQPRVRIGGVAYRDVGDEYVVRPFDFTSDLASTQVTLDRMDADGGGDVPEAVQEALDAAVHRLSWGGPGTLRILFLVGDAPPHFERGTPYTVTMRAAVEKGITIIPVAASGMDDTGEFVWRQLAAVTLGSFLFVSYGGATENHTGPYEENDLDLLMVRAVQRAMDAVWTGRPMAPVPDRSPASNHARPSPSPFPPEYAPPSTTSYPPSGVGFGRAPWDFGVPGWGR